MKNLHGDQATPQSKTIPPDLIRKIRARLNERPQFLRIYNNNVLFCYIIPADVKINPSKPDLRKLKQYQVSEAKFQLKKKRQRSWDAHLRQKKTN